MRTLLLACRTWREWVPGVFRLFWDGDVDRWERDTRAYRARHGIGDSHGR